MKFLPPLLIIVLFLFFSSGLVYAAPCVDSTSNPCPAGLDKIETVFGNVVSVSVYLGFIALLVMIVIAGFKYLTSGGEQKAVQAAHQAMTWAIMGIFFMAIAWIILRIVEAFTGIQVTLFNIKTLF